MQAELERVEERLRAVEMQLGRLTAQLSSEQGGLTRSLEQLRRVCESHARILVGANGRSLVTRVAMLEEAEQSRKWSLRAVWGAAIALLIKLIHDLVRNGR